MRVRLLIISIASCLAVILFTSSPAYAQADTFGYGVNIRADQVEELLVRNKEACDLFLEDAEGRLVRDESCKAEAAVEGDPGMALGFRYKYVPIDSEEIELGVRDTLNMLSGGKAGIYVDKQEPSRLLLNFWKYAFDCGTKKVNTAHPTFLRPLLDLGPDPAISEGCRSVLRVLDRHHYALELGNREKEVFTTQFWYASAVTIPLKHWLGYTADTSGVEFDVRGRATASVNANVMVGYRMGWTDYKYVRGAERKPDPVFHIGPGVFAGFSSASVGSSTSVTADQPLEESVTVVVVSYGTGVLFTARSFAIGLFLGWDHGFGENAKRWDFQGRPWLGVGISTDQLAQVLGVR